MTEQRSLIYNPTSSLLEEFNSMRFNNSGRIRKVENESFSESVVKKLKPTFKMRMSSELKTDRDFPTEAKEHLHHKSSFSRKQELTQDRKNNSKAVKLLLSLLHMA